MSASPDLSQYFELAGLDDSWSCLGREEQMKQKDSYLLSVVADERLLIFRADDGSFEAMRTVCMHKGRSIEFHAASECRSLRCPLHEWTADLDGNLHCVTHAEDDGTAQAWRAFAAQRPIEIKVWQGLIFIR